MNLGLLIENKFYSTSNLGELSLILFSDKDFDKVLGLLEKYTVKVLHTSYTSILAST